MNYNNELEHIDTPNKAYLYGLLFADGNVHWRPDERRGSVNLSLHRNDNDLIGNLLDMFPFFTLVSYNNLLRLYCYDPVCIVHVSAHMPERKSYENKELLTMSRIPSQYKSHALRGFFDGDGSIVAHNGTGVMEISGVSRRFTDDILDMLTSYGIKTSLRIKVPTRPKDKQVLYRIYIFSTSIELMYDLLYKDAQIYMGRKKLEFEKVFKYQADKFMLCPICDTKQLTKFGTKKGKQRYYCKTCKKYSTGSAPLISNSQIKIDPTCTPSTGVR